MSQNTKYYLIEIATTDYPTTKSAVEGGADRIELCAALSEGGITPSHGMIKKCRESFEVDLFPIIRARGGDFFFTEEEFEVMIADVLLCKQTGCDGIVTGFLNKDGTMDLKRMARMIELAYPLEVTCHRAFDRCVDPFKALEELIQIGCQRILTSGQKPTAPEGIDLIAQLVKAADERIIIMPGSGVRPDNIMELKEKTGAIEFHASLRNKQKSKMDFVHPSFQDEVFNAAIDAEEVKSLQKALNY